MGASLVRERADAVAALSSDSRGQRPRVAALHTPGVLYALSVALLVGTLAAFDGGYRPSAWGWTAVAAASIAALGLTLQDRIELSLLSSAMLVGLGGLLAWTLMSSTWTTSVTRTVLEAERTTAYLACAMLLALAAGARRPLHLLVAAWGAISLICTYALATRVLPDRLGVVDPIAEYRLSEPIGYWNGLGIFASIGILLGLALAARTSSLSLRIAGAATLPFLAATVYFTFSRGAIAALAIGLLAWIAVDPRRLQAVTALAALGAAPAVGLLAASRSDGLTQQGSSLADATDEGYRLTLLLVVLAVVSAGAAVALYAGERRLRVSPRARAGYAAVLAAGLVVALGTVFVSQGAPWTLAEDAYDEFVTGSGATPRDLEQRVFRLSSRGRDEHWRLALLQARADPVLGGGAGTYEQYWYRERDVYVNVRDAHSLYLEVLAELGPIGLTLLLVALMPPAAAGLRARQAALVPPMLGAYVAFLAHAGVDWDWELTGVTCAALVVAAALLAAESRARVLTIKGAARAGAAVAVALLGVAAAAGLMSNSAISSARDALEDGRLAGAVDHAHEARRWAPWSSEPWQVLAQARLMAQDEQGARAALRKALERDPDEWYLWLGLAETTSGPERSRALARARVLNPLSVRVREVEEERRP